MHPFVKLAKESVEQFINNKKIIDKQDVSGPEMEEKAGVFICLKMKGELRGCIGTFQPAWDSLADEIIHNAISAATQDPRFSPVDSSELEKLEYTVDVLSEPEQVKSKKDLDHKKYGVIVKSGARKGLLLPDIEGVNTVDEQISIASTKAGIYLDEQIDLFRFEVKRYK